MTFKESRLIIYTPSVFPVGAAISTLVLSHILEDGTDDVSQFIDYCRPSDFQHRVDRLHTRIKQLNFDDFWFTFQSDDTILTKETIQTWRKYKNDCNIMVFSQKRLERSSCPDILLACPENIKPGKIDGAQFFFKISWFNKFNFKWNTFHEYEGSTFEEIYRIDPKSFIFFSDKYCIHDGIYGIRHI